MEIHGLGRKGWETSDNQSKKETASLDALKVGREDGRDALG